MGQKQSLGPVHAPKKEPHHAMPVRVPACMHASVNACTHVHVLVFLTSIASSSWPIEVSVPSRRTCMHSTLTCAGMEIDRACIGKLTVKRDICDLRAETRDRRKTQIP